MDGMKTYTGLAVALLGVILKIFKVDIGDAELTTIVTNIMEIGGIAFAAYGRRVTKG